MVEPLCHESRDGGIPHLIAGGFRLRQPKDSAKESVFGDENFVQLKQSPERATTTGPAVQPDTADVHARAVDQFVGSAGTT